VFIEAKDDGSAGNNWSTVGCNDNDQYKNDSLVIPKHKINSPRMILPRMRDIAHHSWTVAGNPGHVVTPAVPHVVWTCRATNYCKTLIFGCP